MILLICFTTIRKTGFIYGHIVSFETSVPIITKAGYKMKSNPANTLYAIYGSH
jgi:hypothetical protein